MKKLFTLFTLLVAIVMGASADTSYVTYNGEEKSSPDGYFTHDTTDGSKFNFNKKFNGCTYGDVTYTQGLKMEGSTKIMFTTTADAATVVIVQSNYNSGGNISFDGGDALSADDAETITGGLVFTLTGVAAGDHTITRSGSETGIFAVYVTEETGPATAPTITTQPKDVIYKIGVTEEYPTMTVEATASAGELSYRWQYSRDGETFYPIPANAAEAAAMQAPGYAPSAITTTLDGAEAASLVSFAQPAVYYINCVVSDGQGRTTSKTASITIKAIVTELESISEATTWNIASLKGSVEIAEEDRAEDIYVNMDDQITFPADFNANALSFYGQFPIRDSKYAQNGTLHFITTVAGTVTVKFANTGGSNKNRYVQVNDQIGTVEADGTTERTESFEVEAGDVYITGYTPEEEGNRAIRYMSVAFEPAAAAVTYNVTVGNTGYATFSADNNVVVPEGVTVYGAKDNGETVSLTASTATVLSPDYGYIIAAEPGEYVFTSTEDASDYDDPDNELTPTGDSGWNASDGIYVLAEENGVAVMAPIDTESISLIPANKAFLYGNDYFAAKTFVINGATAIEAIEAEAAEAGVKKAIANGKLVIITANGTFNAAGAQVK